MSKELQSFCPNCGETTLGEDTCDSCGFSLGSVLKCPHKEANAICGKTRTGCSISNMDWEICEVFRGSEE